MLLEYLGKWLLRWGRRWSGYYDLSSNCLHNQPGNFNTINTTSLSAQGVLGNLFAGYSWRYCWFYLGAEANGMLSTAKFYSSNEEFIHHTFADTTYKINRAWGVSALPGIVLPQNTLLYGRAGYVSGYFDVDTTDISAANVNTRLNGFRYGLGLQKQICRNFDVRVEYNRIDYQDHSDLVFVARDNVTKKNGQFTD